MHDQQSAPASPPARGLFTQDQEEFLLAQAVGKPSGVCVEVGGVAFNLVPLSTADGLYVVSAVTKFSALWSQISGSAAGGVNEAEVVAALDRDVPRIFEIMRNTLLEAAKASGGEFDQEVFDRWYERTRLIPTLRALVPAILRTNGFEQFADRIERGDARPPKPARKPAKNR